MERAVGLRENSISPTKRCSIPSVSVIEILIRKYRQSWLKRTYDQAPDWRASSGLVQQCYCLPLGRLRAGEIVVPRVVPYLDPQPCDPTKSNLKARQTGQEMRRHDVRQPHYDVLLQPRPPNNTAASA